ncbi:MAG TPA: hypothetical protein VFJ98_09815 [Mycobacteriales bacterium]|nr:hypothetical protein [Mycobacteriales bacterium]
MTQQMLADYAGLPAADVDAAVAVARRSLSDGDHAASPADVELLARWLLDSRPELAA